MVHECHHVRQYGFNPLRFVGLYLSSDAKRAHYEAEAYHVSLEMTWFLRGNVGNVGQIAAKLYSYGCEHDDVRIATRWLKIAAHAVKRGKLYHRVSKNAVRWLRRQATKKATRRRK